jgi:hypothetical protein
MAFRTLGIVSPFPRWPAVSANDTNDKIEKKTKQKYIFPYGFQKRMAHLLLETLPGFE